MREAVAAAAVGLVIAAVGGGASASTAPPTLAKEELRSQPAVDLVQLIQAGAGAQSSVGPDVRVNDPQVPPPEGLLGRSETTLAASADGLNVIAGWNDAQGFCGPPFGAECDKGNQNGLSGFARSGTAGLTWVDDGAPPVIDNIYTRGDPWMDRGGSGGETYYYANLAVDAETGADLGVSVHTGEFQGRRNFRWRHLQVFNAPNAPDDFYDKEALVAGTGFNAATAYVSLTNFQELCDIPQNGFGQIEVWRTHDEGEMWEGPTIAGPEQEDSRRNCGNFGTVQQSSQPALAPDGTVYVVWNTGPTFNPDGSVDVNGTIQVARSLDSAHTWEAPVEVSDVNAMWFNPPVAYNRPRINTHPRIDVAQSGPHEGRVFVTYYSALEPVQAAPQVECPPEVPPGSVCFGQNLVSSQVFVRYSDDRGETWSDATPVAPAPPPTRVKRWWPDVTVGENGVVHVVYLQSRERQKTRDPNDVECNISLGAPNRRVGPNSSLVNTFWTYSQDGGDSFSMPLKVSSKTSNWCTVVSSIRPNMGDYIDADATAGNEVYMTWADGRNGVPDTFFARAIGPK